MATFVFCKNCNNKIYANPSRGNIQMEGNVTYDNVTLDDNSLNFNQGGTLNLGPEGVVKFTSPSKSRIECNQCRMVFDYSTNEFHQE